MPSSTFNFSGEVPPGSWGRILGWALVLTGVALLPFELYLRQQGIVPMVSDDEGLWSYWRQQAGNADSNVVAFLGSSRMQLDIQPEVWRTVFPNHRTIQLAIDGNGPLVILEDLARDSTFCGVVICDTFEGVMTDEEQDAKVDERAKKYVEFYHKRWSLQERGDRMLRTMIQYGFAISRGWDIIELLKKRVHGNSELFSPDYLRTKTDRSRQADYRLADLAKQREHWLVWRQQNSSNPKLPKQREFSNGFRRMRRAAEQIAARGGKVVFVKFPVSGDLRALEEKLYPKAEFWDEFARNINAPAIHFADSPSLRAFTCAEDSHLDVHDAVLFTRALAGELRKHGWL